MNEPQRKGGFPAMGTRLLLGAATLTLALVTCSCNNSDSGAAAPSAKASAGTADKPADSKMTDSSTGMSMNSMPGAESSGSMQSMHASMAPAGEPADTTTPASASPSGGSASTAAATSSEQAQPEQKIDGGQIYAVVCALCHASGLNGAPKYHDQKAWGERVKQGRQTVYDRALHGYRGMPAKGGHPELSDAQVKAAVDFMVEGSGGWRDSN